MTDLAWKAIIKANDPPYLFRHGGFICRLEPNDQATPVIRLLDPNRLRHELARVARWLVLTQTGRKGRTPPMEVVHDVLATPDPPLPILTRVTRVPVFAPNGSLEMIPGYHEKSQTYYAPIHGLELLAVSDKPSVEDVQFARSIICEELLVDFGFVCDADRAHAVALFLLPYVRDLIAGPTPNHLVESPTPGSGKGLLADVALGSAIPHLGSVAQAHTDDEWRKRLTSYFREGREVMFIDNVTGPLDSGTLASALTQLVWEDRVLGRNDTVSISIRCVWVTTANNPTMSTEIARRTIRIRLDTGLDRPWLRDGFRHENLRQWAADNRDLLVWSAQTLVQAWLASGRPEPKCKPLGSYENWSTVVGGVLENAGIPGFLDNLQEFYEISDTETAVWRGFVIGWQKNHGQNRVGVADLFKLAVEHGGFDLQGADERSQKSAFGKQLSKQRDRVIGDYRIVPVGTVQGAAKWRLLPTK